MGEPSSTRDVIPINIKTGQSSCVYRRIVDHTFTDYLGNNALTLSVVLSTSHARSSNPLSFTDIRLNYSVVSLRWLASSIPRKNLYIFLVSSRIPTTIPISCLPSSNFQARVIRIRFLLTMVIQSSSWTVSKLLWRIDGSI